MRKRKKGDFQINHHTAHESYLSRDGRNNYPDDGSGMNNETMARRRYAMEGWYSSIGFIQSERPTKREGHPNSRSERTRVVTLTLPLGDE